MAFNPANCGACGFAEDLHEHHIVPRQQGGLNLPTVWLCVPCHAAIHSRTWDPNHVKLTRDGLAAAKSRGVTLGGFRGVKVDSSMGAKANVEAADAFASSVAPTVRELSQTGLSLARIATALTDRGIRTPRGGAWTATAVSRILAR